MKIPALTLLLASAFSTPADVVIEKKSDPATLGPVAPMLEIGHASDSHLLAAANPPAGATPAISRKRHWEARFAELDTDHDGKLTLEEFLAGPMGKKTPEKARAFFQTIDQAHSDTITLDQWLAAHPEDAGGKEPEVAPPAPGALPASPGATLAPLAPHITAAPAPIQKQSIDFKKTPPAVQKAITAAVGVSNLAGVEKFEEDGRTLYTGKFPTNREMAEYTVDANGAVVHIRMYLPWFSTDAIHDSIVKHVGDGKIDIIEACYDAAGKENYRVRFTTRDGRKCQFTVSKRGALQ